MADVARASAVSAAFAGTVCTLLPGTLLGAESFAPMAELLAKSGISVETDVLGAEPTLPQETRRLAARSDGAPRVWIGHSLGGIAALALARAYPECCAAVICLASTARADTPDNILRRRDQVDRALRYGSVQPVSLETKPLLGVSPDHWLAESLMRQAVNVGVSRFARQSAYAIERVDQRELPPLHLPLLAIAGSEDDICPVDRSEEIARLSVRGVHKTIQGAGHLLPMTHANECATLIIDFLSHIHHEYTP